MKKTKKYKEPLRSRDGSIDLVFDQNMQCGFESPQALGIFVKQFGVPRFPGFLNCRHDFPFPLPSKSEDHLSFHKPFFTGRESRAIGQDLKSSGRASPQIIARSRRAGTGVDARSSQRSIVRTDTPTSLAADSEVKPCLSIICRSSSDIPHRSREECADYAESA
jgi:hypothetical protein